MSKKKKMPATSKEAYANLNPDAIREIYRQILYALSQLGEGTFEQIAQFLKVKPEKIWKRMSELHTMELVYRPGNRRALKSGATGYTWRLTKKSLPKTKTSERALKGKSIAEYSRSITKLGNQAKLF